ncbi:metallophosphoesterase family protein [Clostridium sp. 'White wine YQ']|uniref:metallophosphoesterase family protein n=1 Tax=Clostridium sp. 'White wine YQ' TaxID=3027474 RepID=UPI002365D73D|nr:metallophosphoesterase family protein [Clostridium sp. 'White wine YQ']MDD7793143.1 metallophosphoesterase family protein [Clostridium sp. 'White wine YQ']
MERIALISDIHANIPALEAVLLDIKNRGISRIMCLGDLAGKGASPQVAVDTIRNNCEVVLKGNWDYLISEVNDSYFLEWNSSRLNQSQLRYLKELPLYFDFYMSGKLIRLCHASPTNVFDSVQSTATIEEKLRLFNPPSNETKECDVLIYGHIHVAYIQNFNQKTIINLGSVGVPLKVSQASYGIIEGMYGAIEESSISISLVRVPYNVEKAIKEAKDIDVPDFEKYSHELRTGEIYSIN